MLLPRILAPVRASLSASSKLAAPSKYVLEALRSANASSAPTPTLTLSFARHASHQSQGRANGAKDGPGKRLGAKKSGGEYVIPGNIIFRQRGTSWFPGENCKFGRDHCIFATESGYVRYYKDPRKHPKRQYIGVALEKDHQLPYPPNAARRRRLNMVAVPIEQTEVEEGGQVLVAAPDTGKETGVPGRENRILTMGKGYAYREANWQIGRAAERANVQVKEFVPGDRWAAWRKSQARIAANEEKRRLRNSSKKGGKAKKAR
ncbi:ribosomal L27 protein-domain-containing protein [Paraphoma chrysanthemicola]|uniref:Large ribosomal subunit protein bL27m n=1 Tax=Paraphoma chrysanthemicola TaxID=798071 RepID=A0A8K0QTD0_9PLEO|nr:ribosomal L27 protein-domain-containing protein [Paraphoma chrysanthemicola]